MTDRATLEGWIAQTERNKRRLHKALAPAAVVAAALCIASPMIGGAALLVVVLVGVLGTWIMTSHIADWHERLDQLDKPKPVGRAVRPK